MDFTSRYCRRRFESAVTCPSAALGLNCCQFACCIPTIPAIDFPISLHPDWMGNLVQSRPEITLGDMVIPGTHDSGSYSIDTFKLFSAVGRAQNVTVVEQLHRGARFLDLRIAGAGKNVNIFHGCLKGSLFERVLDDITLFCHDFPGEFVIIHVSAEYQRPFTPVQKKKALDIMKQSLGDKLYMEDDVNKLLTTPVKELVVGGKQVCVLLKRMYDDFEVDGLKYTESYITNEYGFFNADKWLENQWYNTRNVDQLLEWNLDEVKTKTKKGKFLNNQFVLTPGVGGIADVARLVAGFGTLQPVYLANALYKPPRKHTTAPIHSFFAKNASEGWNAISVDFIDLCPALVSLMVGMNFSDFDVVLATVQYGNPNFFRPSMSVTSKVQSHIVRNKVLFLNVGRDFGTNFGTLTLAYKVKDKYFSIVIHFDGTSVIVLNEYNHIQAGSKEIVIEDGIEEGSVNPGGGGTIMTWCKAEEGDEIEFDFDSPF